MPVRRRPPSPPSHPPRRSPATPKEIRADLKKKAASSTSTTSTPKDVRTAQRASLFGTHTTRPLARPGEWEETYLQALRDGHTTTSAAGKAGINPSTAHVRARRDPAFAAQKEAAYHAGTARLVDVALGRATDPDKPSDRVLIHLLSNRGIVSKSAVEVSGPDGGAIPMEHSAIPVRHLSVETRRRMLEDARAAREAEEAAGRSDGRSGETGLGTGDGDGAGIMDAEIVSVSVSASGMVDESDTDDEDDEDDDSD